MTAPVLMIVGTASSVGKSILVSALCRIAARRGLRVAPFKAQNMSNNAAVTADSGEIARSTAVQATAAKVEPSVHMNPILIKPEGDRRSQIVLEGRAWRTLDASEYWGRKRELWGVVTHSLDTLRHQYDLVIAEGAGSPVELNLKPNDIVNMRVAAYAGARTLLVGDIDAGGIFAALLGTLALLEPEERALVRGLIVNRFRGDPALFADGVAILEQRSGLPVLGVVPWIDELGLAEEDAVALERRRDARTGPITVAVVQLPQIANFDDFDPLEREPGIAVRYITHPAECDGAAAVILPGTKHTLAARRWLSARGFDEALVAFKGAIVGICGGYQLLGQQIADPLAVEGDGGVEAGLGLLPVTTVFTRDKRTVQVEACARTPWADGVALRGYEIHMGRTTLDTRGQPMMTITRRANEPRSEDDGCVSPDGRVWGCYIHGLFANADLRWAWLRTLGWRPVVQAPAPDPYDRLADIVEQHLDAGLLSTLFQC